MLRRSLEKKRRWKCQTFHQCQEGVYIGKLGRVIGAVMQDYRDSDSVVERYWKRLVFASIDQQISRSCCAMAIGCGEAMKNHYARIFKDPNR